MARIELTDVSFEYPVFEVAERSIKVALMQHFQSEDGVRPHVRALRNLNLKIEDGERIGLVGANGSGKSTLLKLLAGLAQPTSGTLKIEGRIVPLLEKGIGVNGEFTAAQNIELPLRLLGATSAEIAAAREDVREFSELGAFFDLPVRRYSEGMKARLTFALSTAIRADVLILDEWLSAGDAKFVQKAEARLNAYMDKIKVVVLASHALDLLRKVCTRVAYMHKGEILMLGEPNATIDRYLGDCNGVQSLAAE